MSGADRTLALGYVAPHFRQKVEAAFMLDDALAQIALSPREPVFSQMRLAWWQSELEKIGDPHFKPHDPVLQATAAFPELAKSWLTILEGWQQWVADPDSMDSIEGYARLRGGGLFGVLSDDLVWKEIGTGWAMADLVLASPQGLPSEVRASCEAKLSPMLGLRAEGQIKPLAILAWLSWRDLHAEPEARLRLGSPRRMMRALRYALAGPHEFRQT